MIKNVALYCIVFRLRSTGHYKLFGGGLPWPPQDTATFRIHSLLPQLSESVNLFTKFMYSYACHRQQDVFVKMLLLEIVSNHDDDGRKNSTKNIHLRSFKFYRVFLTFKPLSVCQMYANLPHSRWKKERKVQIKSHQDV